MIYLILFPAGCNQFKFELNQVDFFLVISSSLSEQSETRHCKTLILHSSIRKLGLLSSNYQLKQHLSDSKVLTVGDPKRWDAGRLSWCVEGGRIFLVY